jgi:curved DNA-binding protein CbpA
MSTEIDHYAVLGIGRGASSDEIRGAYRRAARASHPDLHPADGTAAERFKRVQVAYEVLGDPGRRVSYDARVASVVASRPATSRSSTRRPRGYADPDEPVSLAHELGETVAAIRVMARRSGFARRVNRLIRYLERL